MPLFHPLPIEFHGSTPFEITHGSYGQQCKCTHIHINTGGIDLAMYEEVRIVSIP